MSPSKGSLGQTSETDDDDDAVSEASSSGLPPPLIQASGYESFVCGSCVAGIHTLKRLAGTPGAMMVIRDDPGASWKVLGDTSALQCDNPVDASDGTASTSAGTKRPHSPSDTDAPKAKRTRASPEPANSLGPCLAPPLNTTAHKIFTSRAANDLSFGAGDVFLTEGWRDRWCRCHSVGLILACSCILFTNFIPPSAVLHSNQGLSC